MGLKGFPPPLFVFQDSQEKETVTPERAEEAKLKAKYPNLGQKPGGSDFLMKRLQKGVFISQPWLVHILSSLSGAGSQAPTGPEDSHHNSPGQKVSVEAVGRAPFSACAGRGTQRAQAQSSEGCCG